MSLGHAIFPSLSSYAKFVDDVLSFRRYTHKVPELLPAFWLKGGEVSRYVLGGADLMFPGIHIPAEGLPKFLAGEPWAVKVPGNPAPIAVGWTTMSNTEALKAGLRGKALKISHCYGDTLWSGHVLPCRPSGVTLDVKKSSYKKLSKWLQAKASAGLISVKEDKHKKEVTLFSVNRSHPEYESFRPEKKKVVKVGQSTGEQGNYDGQAHKIFDVSEVYKPSVHVNPIFVSVGAELSKLFSASEASDIAFQYVEKHNLVKPTQKSMVTLDATLCDALYKGAIKKGSTYPTEIHKKDLGSTFISRMQAHHRVTRGSDTVINMPVEISLFMMKS